MPNTLYLVYHLMQSFYKLHIIIATLLMKKTSSLNHIYSIKCLVCNHRGCYSRDICVYSLLMGLLSEGGPLVTSKHSSQEDSDCFLGRGGLRCSLKEIQEHFSKRMCNLGNAIQVALKPPDHGGEVLPTSSLRITVHV